MALDRLTNITRSGLGSVHSYDVAGVVAVGVITASSFSGNITGNITGNIVGDVTGNVTGNVTGTATTATNLANAANITTGTISNDRLPATITKNLTGNVTGNADTASNLTGSPSITVTDITASGNISIGGTLTYDDVTNIDSVGVVTARTGIDVTGGHIDLVDNSRIRVGTDDDLQIFHDGSQNAINSFTSNPLNIISNGNTTIKTNNNDSMAVFKKDNAVELYYNNTKRFSTTVDGAAVHGNLGFTDNDKIEMGQSSDLQIYHNGSNSYIDDSGTGALFVRGSYLAFAGINGEQLINAEQNAAVELFHDGTKKLETTTTGATVTGTLVSELDLNAISASISDTAVDIFVYDTRKDSDGGAWRKRTQHTSWYNETLNTSNRGSRKEFPAVAVIVATTASVFIYDGDDPDLPLWMKFRQSTNGLGAMVGYTSFTIGCVTMLNGLLMVGLDATNQGNVNGLRLINFISEQFSWKADSASRNSSQHWPIEDRNGGRNLGYNDENYIVSELINDVAATVLPNSQIDDATGLPVPTIAVATKRGVSIIKDNGSVADLEHNGGTHETCRNIAFSEDKTKVLFTADYNDDPTYNRRVIVEDIPSGDSTFTVVQDDSYQIAVGGYDNNGPRILGTSNGSSAVGGIDHLLSQATATSEGVTLLDNELDNILKSKVAYVTADYNTGWMVGDIKGAFLSDTDTTNVSPSSNLVSNGDFADTNLSNYFTLVNSDANGGSEANSAPYVNGSNQVVMGNSAQLKTNYNLVAGRVYKLSYDCVNQSISAQRLGIYVPSGASLNFDDSITAGGTNTYYYTATSTGSTLIEWRSRGGGWGTYDNFTIIESTEQDRSANAKGLQVFGTITKQPVATGAELVSYSGWSSSNYLRQLYNSDLNFGTGNWSYMFWYNPEDAESGDIIFSRWSYNVDGNQAPRISAYFNSGNLRVDTADASAGSGYQGHFGSDATQDSNEWHCAVILRRGPNLEIWIDGINYRNAALNSTSDGSYTDSNSILEFGHSPGTGASEAGLELALFRISATAPSPEQIKKMYEDEKMLFQENAKATLYGSSDAVTALGYDEDTELLHVGTSAGRSDFQGLCRINNTTTAVTTAISASDEFIAEQ